jgi:hypothetical protein
MHHQWPPCRLAGSGTASPSRGGPLSGVGFLLEPSPQTPLPERLKGGQNAGVVWRFTALRRPQSPSPPAPLPRGSGVARSDGVRAFQRVRTQNTPWAEPMFFLPMNPEWERGCRQHQDTTSTAPLLPVREKGFEGDEGTSPLGRDPVKTLHLRGAGPALSEAEEASGTPPQKHTNQGISM